MSSTSNSTDVRFNICTNYLSNAIKHGLIVGTMTEPYGKILRKVLIKIQTDTALLDAISSFNE